jgi:hypothetical protein
MSLHAAGRVAALLIVAGLLAGCGSPSTSGTKGSGPLTIRIHLDQARVPAGMPLAGYAVLTNDTRRSVLLEGCPSDWLTVGLASPSIPFDPAFADDCFGTNRLAPGTHRIPISGYTTYSGCGGGPSMHELTCPRFGDPLLPLGTYGVKVITMGVPKDVVIETPAPVTLVNARTGSSTGAEGGSILVEATACGYTGTKTTERLPVSVTVLRGTRVVGAASGRGIGQFIFPAAPGRYVVRTSAHRGGIVHASNGVQSYINLFSSYRVGTHWRRSCSA